MVLFNYSTKEITAKIVYYGPGLCGKTTNLQFIYDNLSGTINKGKMLSLATKTDRTLFFDFLPIDLGTIRGMRTRLQLYTVPGQVFYNTTRKLVLKGADGVVFVADSQKRMIEANLESFKNLEENLAEHDMKLSAMPLIIQFNKRDLPGVASIEELNAAINIHNSPIYEGVATTGIGVHETLKAITRLVLNSLKEKYADKREQRVEPPPQVTAAAASAARAAQPPAAAVSIAPAIGLMTKPAPPPAPARPPASFMAPTAEPVATPHDLGLGDDLPDFPELEEESPAVPEFTFEEESTAPPEPIAPSPALPASLQLSVTPASPSQAGGRTFARPSPAGEEEPVLELVEDAELVLEPDGGDFLELAEEEAPLEPFFEPAIEAPAPLDVTEEVFRVEEPIFSDDSVLDEPIPPIPLAPEIDTGPAMSVSARAPKAPAPLAVPRSEDRHEDPLDLAVLGSHGSTPPAGRTRVGMPGEMGKIGVTATEETGPQAAPGIFEDDRLSIPFEDAPSVPLASPPPARRPAKAPAPGAAPDVAAVAAAAAGARGISLPISLDIGGKSIRFQLKVCLDLTSGPSIESLEEQREEGAL